MTQVTVLSRNISCKNLTVLSLEFQKNPCYSFHVREVKTMKKMRKLCLCFALLLTINSFAFTAIPCARSAARDDYPLSEFPWD